MMSWLDIVDQRLMWPGTAYGRARAAWRRVLGLLDSFMMSFSQWLRLVGSTRLRCRSRSATFEPWRTGRPLDATGAGTVVTSALDLV